METNPHNDQNLKEKILAKIDAKKLSMHPKYYFFMRVAALIVVSIAIFFISIFIFNFLLFSIRINSQDTFLAFGPRGWRAFLMFFPWDLFIFDVVLVCMLLWLLRQFRFGYKSPLLYLLLGLCVVTGGIGLLLDRGTGLNDHFLKEADERHLPPPLNAFYVSARHLPPPESGVCRCVILSLGDRTLVLVDPRNASTTFTVTLPLNDPRATTSGLKPGDTVFVAGEREDGSIRAFGVQRLYIRQ